MKCTAIVLTGGSGQRIKEIDYPKQFCEIKGKPVFIHSLEIYEQMERVNEIFLVINADHVKRYQDILKKFKISKLQTLVDGGEFRQDSVENALAAIEQTDYIILHDGANPTTRADFINDCIDAAFEHSNACQ
jgi:2-C-methyl-D-erythritol 4-phosphate cytidylyltransferase